MHQIRSDIKLNNRLQNRRTRNNKDRLQNRRTQNNKERNNFRAYFQFPSWLVSRLTVASQWLLNLLLFLIATFFASTNVNSSSILKSILIVSGSSILKSIVQLYIEETETIRIDFRIEEPKTIRNGTYHLRESYRFAQT